MSWKPTPKSRLIIARRLDVETGEWAPCRYTDLKPGDIFKAFAGDNQIDPTTQDEVEDYSIAALCHAHPVRATEDGVGHMVEVTVAPIADLMRMVSN
jgi:hypothetical protein